MNSCSDHHTLNGNVQDRSRGGACGARGGGEETAPRAAVPVLVRTRLATGVQLRTGAAGLTTQSQPQGVGTITENHKPPSAPGSIQQTHSEKKLSRFFL